MKQNAITQAIGALKLVPIFVNNPAIISRATLIGASAEAVAMLEALPAVTAELAEVFRRVDAVILEGQTAYVTPTRCPEYPYGAVIADSKGNICAAAMGKTQEGLAELIRLKLLPQQEGCGEDVA
ncbi:hypothetical protein [Pseudomonas weihenstephanensis]|uniref:Uncharacterized protein n=1 Tax=Pseudomonas weihenstephanensis TaxID=1608994 RepID=A0A0J6IF11_9PSED|nr:hypothetical protein [Pseudomonas weihenstephanensis]KMN13205.1 hypothetical protein TU86_14120 [Pseudomonas weihenstephanensis]MBM1191625.1 hypothetical protein [Pseudomonas weihenstephanensis]